MPLDALTDTAEFPPSPSRAVGPSPIRFAPSVDADIAGMTHTGKVRTNNEDNFLVVRFGRFLQTMLTSLPEGHLMPEHALTGYGMAVADGMGGTAAGEVASRLALTVLVDLVLETPDWILSPDDPHMEKVIERAIRRFDRVNESVLEEARRQPWLKGMGTTLTMACSLGAHMLIAHVGDSPVYLLRGGGLHRLTRDHTLAQQMAEHGSIPLRAVPPRYRHKLTQAIGVREAGGEPDIRRLPLEDGDRLLLCSDGLTDMVDDATIAVLLKDNQDSEAACRNLVDLALEHGGRDNITVVVATYRIARGK
jgi:PPM family protein phosphatase